MPHRAPTPNRPRECLVAPHPRRGGPGPLPTVHASAWSPTSSTRSTDASRADTQSHRTLNHPLHYPVAQAPSPSAANKYRSHGKQVPFSRGISTVLARGGYEEAFLVDAFLVDVLDEAVFLVVFLADVLRVVRFLTGPLARFSASSS